MANIIKTMITDNAKDIVKLNSMTLKDQKEYLNKMNNIQLWMISAIIDHLPDKYYVMGLADAYMDKDTDSVFETAWKEVVEELKKEAEADSSDNVDQ